MGQPNEVTKIELARKDFRDRVYACWLGKNIGGTLGAPFEGSKYVNDLTFYEPVPAEPLPNDDLDLQLVWLCMLEKVGSELSIADFASYWRRYLMAYPWNEYGFCARNLERGLAPPISGWFENYYVDEMGSPIRSEIWACVAPADPQRAAALAWMDAAMDHAGGEGMWGEMFWAAVESAAFVERDPERLIEIGLTMIPPACNIARVIREAVWCWRNGKRWAQARDRIVNIYGNTQPCNAIQNHGFTILGWLYGEDFGERLCKAVNCGYDTDCTGATLGALLGILGGRESIPAKWSEPVGTTIAMHKFTGPIAAPKDIDELTERTLSVTDEFAGEVNAQTKIGEKESLPVDLSARLLRSELAEEALKRDLRVGTARDRGLEISFHYHGGPVFHPDIARRLSISWQRLSSKSIGRKASLSVPKGWELKALADDGEFEIQPVDFEGTAWITVQVEDEDNNYQAKFAAFSPSTTAGFPSGANIEYCQVCQGRKGSCLCE